MMGAIQSASRRRTVAAANSPLHNYDWSSGNATGSETVTRSGTATYINSSGNRVSAAVNTARIDYSGESPNTVLGLLVEPAATNNVIQSSDIAVGWGTTNLTLGTAAGTGMGGTNTLKSFTQTAIGGQFSRGVTVPASAKITATWYLKAGTGRWVFLTFHDGNFTSQVHCWFDLQTGLPGTTSAGGSAFSGLIRSSRLLGNGIVECTMTAQAAAGFTEILLQCNMSNGDNVWDGTSGHVRYFDSVQVETSGQSTSFVPTTTAAVSRGAETVTIPMTNRTYDILVMDKDGGEWRNGVVVSGGVYTVTPKTGRRHVLKVVGYANGVLSTAEKEVLAAPPPYPYTSGMVLTWRDEFTDTNVARLSDSGMVTSGGTGKTWRTRFAHGGGGFSSATINNESQLYTNSGTGGYLGLNPFEISGSTLKIRASRIPGGTANVPTNTRYDPDAPYRHYSGMISSEPNKLFTYGVFEIRSRSEAKYGTWPAFWLIRTIADGDLQLGGEIDIFEHMGDDPGQTHQTFHEWDAAHFVSAKQPTFPNGGTIADWHVYACKWEPNLVVFYIDGIETHRVTGRSFLNDRQMMIIANLATNVSLWREPNETAVAEADKTGVWEPPDNVLPALLEIDYIRVYQTSGTPDNS